VPVGILAGLSAVRVLDADRGTGLQGGATGWGALLVIAGLMLFVYAMVGTPGTLPPLLIFGAGGGLTLATLASLGMSGTTQRDAGLASGLFNTIQQIGAALGVAVLSTLAAAQTRSLHPTGTGLATAAIIVAAVVLRRTTGSRTSPGPPAPATTRRTGFPTDKPPVAAECSEQITRICTAASLPELDCTTAQIGGSARVLLAFSIAQRDAPSRRSRRTARPWRQGLARPGARCAVMRV
jgi:hypothetical protein